MKYYYMLWGDAINWSRSSIRTIGIWKMQTIGFITLAMSFNLGALCLIIEKIIQKRISFFHLSIEISNSPSINGFLGAMLLFYFPPLFFNYFLIFYKKKWDTIRKKYPYKNGKLYKGYVFLSFSPLLILFITAVIYKLINQLNPLI